MTVRIARNICACGFLVIVVFELMYLLDRIEGFRPHGKTIVLLSTFGIIIPLIVILGDKKFTKKMTNLLISWLM
jgi:hypothetical protein